MKEYTHPYVHYNIIYNSQNMEATQVTINSQVDKNMVPHIYILLDQEKNEILPFVIAWVDLVGIMLSEVSQRKKDKLHMISLVCGI